MILQTWHRRGLLIAVGCIAFVIIGSSLFSSYQWMNKPFPGFFLYGNLAVAPDFLPHWSGRRGGLRFLDRVVAFQGVSITHPEEIYDLVRRNPPLVRTPETRYSRRPAERGAKNRYGTRLRVPSRPRSAGSRL